jgi:hypothetical protein
MANVGKPVPKPLKARVQNFWRILYVLTWEQTNAQIHRSVPSILAARKRYFNQTCLFLFLH